MKRNYILFLVICLSVVLTACSRGTTEETAAAAESTETATTVSTQPPTSLPTEAVTEPVVVVPETTEPAQILPPEIPEHVEDADFVKVTHYIPDIVVDLKYATEENLAGYAIYDFTDVYLRAGTVKKLIRVQEELRELGLGLKIWDGFRPVSAQRALWKAYPDPNFISHPDTGSRTHCRGNTVDVTLVDRNGVELEMPSGFDDFSAGGDKNYSDCSDAAALNAGILQYVMEKNGFTGIYSEWWHYVDNKDYPVDEKFNPETPSVWYAVCESYINLRMKPDSYSTSMARILKDEEFLVLAITGDFALAEYRGIYGYVHRGFIGKAA